MTAPKRPNTNNDPIAVTDKSYMYFWKGVPYLPHYVQKGVFVPPGRNAEGKYAVELEVLGAIKKEVFLWPRHWMNEKSRMVR